MKRCHRQSLIAQFGYRMVYQYLSVEILNSEKKVGKRASLGTVVEDQMMIYQQLTDSLK
jgi:hypothetical protein